MKKFVGVFLALVCAVALLAQVDAQPGREKPKEPSKEKSKDYSSAPIVVRLLAFDKDKDGKLTKEEVTDTRLHRLFDRADTNKDGVVTKAELLALAAALETEAGPGDDRRPGDKGPGGRPGPGGPGDKGPGPGGRPGGPPQPGQILPSFLQERLNLTADQKKQLAELQKEVDSKLEKILNDEQKKLLKEMRERGPGGRPGGPPPKDKGDRPGRPGDEKRPE